MIEGVGNTSSDVISLTLNLECQRTEGRAITNIKATE